MLQVGACVVSLEQLGLSLLLGMWIHLTSFLHLVVQLNMHSSPKVTMQC